MGVFTDPTGKKECSENKQGAVLYYSSEIISYLQTNKILALTLDHALTGVGKVSSNQLETAGAGAMRVLYYTS